MSQNVLQLVPRASLALDDFNLVNRAFTLYAKKRERVRLTDYLGSLMHIGEILCRPNFHAEEGIDRNTERMLLLANVMEWVGKHILSQEPDRTTAVLLLATRLRLTSYERLRFVCQALHRPHPLNRDYYAICKISTLLMRCVWELQGRRGRHLITYYRNEAVQAMKHIGSPSQKRSASMYLGQILCIMHSHTRGAWHLMKAHFYQKKKTGLRHST